MDYLYKLVTTENVEINYDVFKKKELIECLSTMRNIYFRLQQENQQYKKVIDNIKYYLEENGNQMSENTNYDLLNFIKEV